MTSFMFLELFVSLTVQVTILIAVAAWVARRTEAGRNADFCWAALHVSILIVTIAAIFLPHLRLTTWADLNPMKSYPVKGAPLDILGLICQWIWAAGAISIFFVIVAGMIKAVKVVRRAELNERLRQQLVEWVPALNSTSRPVDIRLSDASTGAFCWQFHRPLIALPSIIADFPPAEQAAIVRHELAHLRRHHPLHLFMQRVVEAIYWFHPLVWWASRRAAAAREIRCDRDAVASKHEVAIYLRSLLRLIEMRLNTPSLLPAGLGFLGDASLLSRRTNLLVDSFEGREASVSRWRPMLVMAVAVVVCVLVWLPVNPRASRRADWSPWPHWSARSLEAVGYPVRDYEIDSHRLDGHSHID
jgi:bla regulator protein blaR1